MYLYKLRIFNSRDKLKYSIAFMSWDRVLNYLDSKKCYARNGWYGFVDYYKPDDLDTLLDHDVFFFLNGVWSN